MSMYRIGSHTIVPELPEKTGYQVMVRRVTTNTDGLTEDFVWLAVLPEPAYFVPGTSDAYVTLLATIYAAENGMWYRCDMLAESKRWVSCTLAGTLEGEYGEIATITKDSFSPDSDDIRVCANYDLRMANTVDGRLEPYGDVLVAASTPVLVPEVANPGGVRFASAPEMLLMGYQIGRQLMWQREQESAPMLYFYGTQSENGNIGLRRGDTVSYYNGAVLPALPNWSNCAYWLLTISNQTYNVTGMTVKPVTQQRTAWGATITEVAYTSGTWGTTFRFIDPDEMLDWGRDWSKIDFEPIARDSGTSLDLVDWANFDVLNPDGSVYLAGTAPIPVGEIVDTINGIPIFEDLR